MSIATTLKTFNIGKAKDANGKEIDPEVGWTTGLVMWVAFRHFRRVHETHHDSILSTTTRHPTQYGATLTPRSDKSVELIKAAAEELEVAI